MKNKKLIIWGTMAVAGIYFLMKNKKAKAEPVVYKPRDYPYAPVYDNPDDLKSDVDLTGMAGQLSGPSGSGIVPSTSSVPSKGALTDTVKPSNCPPRSALVGTWNTQKVGMPDFVRADYAASLATEFDRCGYSKPADLVDAMNSSFTGFLGRRAGNILT